MDSNQQPQIQNTGVGQPYPGFPQANPGVSAGAAPGLTPAAGAFAGPAAAPTVNPYAAPQPGVPAGMPAQPAAMPYAAAPQHPNSTQNTLQIAEIRDGIVIMNDGSVSARSSWSRASTLT
jgi:hypothetical protein